jgi:hypothetical protein
VTSLGGADEIRTRDPLLAKQMLYQLSYDPRQVQCVSKEQFIEKYFVRSIETQKTAQVALHRFLRPSARTPEGVFAVSLERR